MSDVQKLINDARGYLGQASLDLTTQGYINQLADALENAQTTIAEDLTYQRKLEAAQKTMAYQVSDAIRADQKRVATLPDTLKSWTGDQARAWSNGMSNASRIAARVLRSRS